MQLDTILVPVDFSTCSLLVTKQAANLASKVGGRLVILHVGELPNAVPAATRVLHDGVAEAAGDYVLHDTERQLADYLAVAAEAGVPATVAVALGKPAETILQQAQLQHADLIVMGTHGRKGLARMVLGSVAESVLHGAHVPVMIIRRETRPECARADCQWCPHKGLSEAEKRIQAEAVG
jgi:nucleotide-binding universal stress UspA family protein